MSFSSSLARDRTKILPSDHLKTKKTCKHGVKELLYLIRYIPDQYKTQQLCDKDILENGGTLQPVLDCHKNLKMCDKAVTTHPSIIQYVPVSTVKICNNFSILQ